MRDGIKAISHNKQYIIFAGMLLLIGGVAGVFFAEQLYSYIASQLDKIQQLGDKISASDNPLYGSWVIFLNNLIATFTFIILGSLLAIVPFMGLLVNGAMIGVVLNIVSETGISFLSALGMFVVGILPHGIFEIPAILIAGGFGMKLGIVWIRPLSGLGRWESYKKVWAEVYKVLPVLMGLLLTAALVEGLVTPILIQFAMSFFGNGF